MVTASLKAKRLAHVALYFGCASIITLVIATSTDYWYITSSGHGGIYTQYEESIATYVDLHKLMIGNLTFEGSYTNLALSREREREREKK